MFYILLVRYFHCNNTGTDIRFITDTLGQWFSGYSLIFKKEKKNNDKRKGINYTVWTRSDSNFYTWQKKAGYVATGKWDYFPVIFCGTKESCFGVIFSLLFLDAF